ncbi:TetR/AcrR family transcriptional regulator C-terminal domain-containing protein [Streptomyces sp. cmx-4-7]|uniref:TetR/AcrR family transcriptional regulator C-terminal domain-containing protein n=1 Tax=Streptomyces sp. cmx-4-7 TaxID=2790939 RepID=UPI003980B2AB
MRYAGRPLTADYLAESLRWTYDRTADALAYAWDRPDLGGPYALRRAAPHHFTPSPRNDVLTDQQMDWVHPADHAPAWRTPHRPPGSRRPHRHDVALGLFDAIEAHPWLASQLTAQLSHHPTGPVTTRIFEAIGRQVHALDAPASSWLTATTALMHYILGAAGQNAANLVRARDLGPEADRSAYMDTVAGAWKRLSPEDYPFTRAVADQGLNHDDRVQFLAGIDLIIAGVTAQPPTLQ